MGPLEQCTVIFCLASLTSSTLKTELPAANDAPLHSTQRSASRLRRRASFWGFPPEFMLIALALPTRMAASPRSPRMCHPVVMAARRAWRADCSPSKSVRRARTPAAGPVMESSIRRHMSSGLGVDGPPLPMVDVRPYSVQYAVAGSGLPSSSSSDVVNLRHIRNMERVYTSREVANCLPPRDQPSRSALAPPAAGPPAAVRARAPSAPPPSGPPLLVPPEFCIAFGSATKIPPAPLKRPPVIKQGLSARGALRSFGLFAVPGRPEKE
mmetsp:Transcript_6473/g.15523  ORF Transcript_6473/g.15523 Transcript_6473/m.15523 type:complete len:268 (-) Transcript_6473:507-1310(-)